MKQLLVLSSLLCIFCSVKAQEKDVQDFVTKEMVVGTWNIGHFSRGKVDYSTISISDYEKELTRYRNLVNNTLKVDILCVNEFSDIFYRDSLEKHIWAETSIFGGYKEHRVFKQNRFVCNAIFGKTDLRNAGMQPYLYTDSIKKERWNIDWFYYACVDITIGGEDVKLVCTHLINRADRLCQDQISQLIKAFEPYDRVIICGDMNTVNFTKFVDAGYMLANDGTLVTFPRRSDPLDNIIVKGLKVSDVKVIKTDLSDHYPLVCRISL